MFLVHGLPSDTEATSDGLPRPPQATCVVDVDFLEFLDQVAKRGNRGEPDDRVTAVDGVAQLRQLTHNVSLG